MSSFDELKRAKKRAEIIFTMKQKSKELSEIIQAYCACPVNCIRWEGMFRYYGINHRVTTISELKLADKIAENLLKLTIQNRNLMLYYPKSEEIFSDLRFSFKNGVFNAKPDEKLNIFIRSRILYNQRNYGINSDDMPQKRSMYNEFLLDTFLKFGRFYLFFDPSEKIENAPTMPIVEEAMKNNDFVRLGGIDIYSRKLHEEVASQVALGKKIFLVYK